MTTFPITNNHTGKTILADHIPEGWHLGTAEQTSSAGHKIDFSKIYSRIMKDSVK